MKCCYRSVLRASVVAVIMKLRQKGEKKSPQNLDSRVAKKNNKTAFGAYYTHGPVSVLIELVDVSDKL